MIYILLDVIQALFLFSDFILTFNLLTVCVNYCYFISFLKSSSTEKYKLYFQRKKELNLGNDSMLQSVSTGLEMCSLV